MAMIYSDKEMHAWWDGKSNSEKTELFEKIEDKCNDEFKGIIAALQHQHELKGKFTVKQLNLLRKWDR